MIRLMSETFDRATLFVRGVGYNICKPCQFFTFQHTVFTRGLCKTRNPGDLPAETETGVGTARVRGKLGTHLTRDHTDTHDARTIFHTTFMHTESTLNTACNQLPVA